MRDTTSNHTEPVCNQNEEQDVINMKREGAKRPNSASAAGASLIINAPIRHPRQRVSAGAPPARNAPA